ncbi:hypothetical protein AAFF_G00403580 [Aldrovandia affinis]|uniref:Uncharacterized protein n=1 Tax=Aldrovandia affinis TaxID=143900 RepID=A0AAD7T7D2_9TELE|nr:hypothetical protein AAFF_G00403580 [Aldrovandia affinis]
MVQEMGKGNVANLLRSVRDERRQTLELREQLQGSTRLTDVTSPSALKDKLRRACSCAPSFLKCGLADCSTP